LSPRASPPLPPFPTRRSSDLVDSSDNIYVAGDTFSTDFPTKNALQSVIHGFRDAFVLKIGATFRPDLTGSWSELSQTCQGRGPVDRKSTRLNSSHGSISYAVF